MIKYNFKGERTNDQLIAIVENRNILDSLVVYVGSVFAAEIPNGHLSIRNNDGAVVATNGIAFWAQVTVLTASNKKLGNGDGDVLAFTRPFENA